jgi:hypothetical protein
MATNVDDAKISECLSLLRERGAAEIAHSGTSLYEHLVGVFQVLRSWDTSPDVALAGLFHSAYGTESFGASLCDIADRSQLANVIGESAERLVFQFSSLARGTLYGALLGAVPGPLDAHTGLRVLVDEQNLIDLVVLNLANTYELSQRDPTSGGITELERQAVHRIRHRLPVAAVRWIDDADTA